jgi:tRNA(Met) cytidine acetyltransferase
MLRALSSAGDDLYRAARRRFAETLPLQLADSLRALEAELAARLLPVDDPATLPFTTSDWRELHGFAAGQRLYEAGLPLLHTLALHAFQSQSAATLTAPQEAVLILKLLQKCSWSETAVQLVCAGRNGVLQLLREAVSALLKVYEVKESDGGIRDE